MRDIKGITESLTELNYKGPCANADELHWALRVGAPSAHYMELLEWLESESKHVINDKTSIILVMKLIGDLKTSVLNGSKMDNERGCDFRLDAIEYISSILLINQCDCLQQMTDENHRHETAAILDNHTDDESL